MSIKKECLKRKKICKATFEFPKKAANGAKKVNVVGGFNGWNFKATPMKSLRNGEFMSSQMRYNPHPAVHNPWILL